MEQRRAVTLAEAAALASTSIDTIRRKLRKGELRKAHTNKRGVYIDLESLRDAFDLPGNAGQPESMAETVADAQAALQDLVRELEAKLAEMRLEAAKDALRHQEEVSALGTRLAVATALVEQRQSEIDRLTELVRASAVQVPSIRAEAEQAKAELTILHERMVRAEQDRDRATAELAVRLALPWWGRLFA